MSIRKEFYIENGRLYYKDIYGGPYEVTCTVEQFLYILEQEGY